MNYVYELYQITKSFVVSRGFLLTLVQNSFYKLLSQNLKRDILDRNLPSFIKKKSYRTLKSVFLV